MDSSTVARHVKWIVRFTKTIDKTEHVLGIYLESKTKQKLFQMFNLAEALIDNYRPPLVNVTYFSSSYLLLKLLEIIQLEEDIPEVPCHFYMYLLSLEKVNRLVFQDRIWEIICMNAGWTFYASVQCVPI